METLSKLLTLCVGNPLVTGGFPLTNGQLWCFGGIFFLHFTVWLQKLRFIDWVFLIFQHGIFQHKKKYEDDTPPHPQPHSPPNQHDKSLKKKTGSVYLIILKSLNWNLTLKQSPMLQYVIQKTE